MKTKDFLIVAFAPFSLLWIPLVGTLTVDGWDWSLSDFVLMWCVLATATFFYRLLATRKWATPPYRLAAGLAIVTGFLITWISLAVQIIGDDNPGNVFYPGVILFGLVGVGVSRFRADTLAKVAFTMAGAILLIPLVSVLFWPADFAPGFAKVCILNSFFVGLFAISGLLFRHAAGRRSLAPT